MCPSCWLNQRAIIYSDKAGAFAPAFPFTPAFTFLSPTFSLYRTPSLMPASSASRPYCGQVRAFLYLMSPSLTPITLPVMVCAQPQTGRSRPSRSSANRMSAAVMAMRFVLPPGRLAFGFPALSFASSVNGTRLKQWLRINQWPSPC